MVGFVMIPRDIWSDATFVDGAFSEREAWIWLIAEASWKPREKRIGTRIIQTLRGQLAAAIRFMAEAWRWPKSNVDRFLKRLSNRNMISVESGTGISVITICNYEEYQTARSTTGTILGHNGDAAGTNDNKRKKRKKERTEESISMLSETDEIEKAIAAYNAKTAFTNWPRVPKLTASRKVSMHARLVDAAALAGWQDALSKAAASDFLCGRTGPRPFLADFDFLVKESSFTKLMEGKYDNRTATRKGISEGSKNGADPALEQIARLSGLS